MSQAAPIKNDRVDRVDRNRQQFTSECRVGERNHHQSGAVQAESQHDRRQPTLVVDTITVMETVKGTTSICRIDQESSCNTRNAYQATTYSTSMIKRMIQPHARTFSSNFLTSSSNTIMPKTSSELSQHGENWVKNARSMWRELLSDAALYSTFFEQECCTTLRPIHGLKNEAWRKLKLSNWKAWTGGSSCSLSPSE